MLDIVVVVSHKLLLSWYSCIPELSVAWSRELSSGLFSSAPLIADINADNVLDVAVVSFSGDVDVIRGADSERLRGSLWPLRLNDVSVHSSPLLVSLSTHIS